MIERFANAQMRETRTAKGSGCPTLLHYLAKVLLKTDARLILFLEDIPSLEPAARCECRYFHMLALVIVCRAGDTLVHWAKLSINARLDECN